MWGNCFWFYENKKAKPILFFIFSFLNEIEILEFFTELKITNKSLFFMIEICYSNPRDIQSKYFQGLCSWQAVC